MSHRRRRRLPSVCVDEHISPEVAVAFRQVLQTVEASKLRELKGRDERDYIRELRAQNTVFATSDVAFVEHIRRHNIRHAGIIYIPNRMTGTEKLTFAEIAAAFVLGGSRSSSVAFHNCILYPAHDGLRLIRPRRGNELAFSWHWLSQVRGS